MIRSSCLVACLLASPAAFAADVAVFPPAVVNLTPAQAEAVATILAQAYGRVSGLEVLPPRRTGLPPGGDLPAAAQALGVREYLELSVIGLLSNDGREGEGRIILQAWRRLASGQTVYQAEMTASSLGDTQVVAERLARALWESRPPESTLSLHTVTGREAEPEKRTYSEKVLGVKTQLIVPIGAGPAGEPMVAVGFDARLEGRSYFLEFSGGYQVPASSTTDSASGATKGYGGLYGELGGSVYLSEGSISPYVGGGVLPRIFGGGMYDGGALLAIYGQAGLMFWRESSTRLYLDLRVAQNLVPLRDRDGSGTSTRRYPTELGLQAGIGW
jgi:hypothetical protein